MCRRPERVASPAGMWRMTCVSASIAIRILQITVLLQPERQRLRSDVLLCPWLFAFELAVKRGPHEGMRNFCREPKRSEDKIGRGHRCFILLDGPPRAGAPWRFGRSHLFSFFGHQSHRGLSWPRLDGRRLR